MKKKYYSIVIVFFSFIFTSCDKFLSTEPSDFLSPVNYYETEQQLQYALNGVYEILGQSALYGNYLITTSGDIGDEGFYAVKSTVTGVMVCNTSISEIKVLEFWQALYTGISRANFLLENVDKPENVENRDVIRGEALFLRAYYYYLLVTNFGDVPLVLHSITSAEGNNIPRTASTQVYEQIVQDMETADGLVSDITNIGYGGRVSKSAVRAVLARVNLSWAGYPLRNESRYGEARKWALKVMTDDVAQHSLNPDFKEVFINHSTNKYNIKESIWEVEFWSDGTGNYKEYGRVGCNNGIITTNETVGYAYGYINANARVYRLYNEKDSLRRDWTIAPFKYNNTTGEKIYFTLSSMYSRNCGKWRREYETITPKIKGGTPQNFPLVRYSDVLLMFAEADNFVNNGPRVETYDAINQVRRRGWGKLLPGATNPQEADLPSGLDKDQFQKELQDERSRELAFECLRKKDLIRWGIYVETLKKSAEEITAEAPSGLKYGALAGNNVSTRDLLLPIPDYERGVNSALTQNDGY